MRRTAAVGALALLLTGCSLMGLYDGDAWCRFAPPGPPSGTAGAPAFTLYNASGQRGGTIVPQAGASSTVYSTSGQRGGTIVPGAGRGR